MSRGRRVRLALVGAALGVLLTYPLFVELPAEWLVVGVVLALVGCLLLA